VLCSDSVPATVGVIRAKPERASFDESSTHLRHTGTSLPRLFSTGVSSTAQSITVVTSQHGDDVTPEPEMNCGDHEPNRCQTSTTNDVTRNRDVLLISSGSSEVA